MKLIPVLVFALCLPVYALPGSDDLSLARFREEAVGIAASMDDSLLASQTLLAALDNKPYLGSEMKTMLKNFPPGGIMLFRYNLNSNIDEVRSFIGECAVWTASASGIVPFMAVDHEGGLVHRFGPGVEKLPPASFFGDLAAELGREAALKSVEERAFRSGREIRGLGITLNLAPVAEVLNGENAAFLESRSYGSDAFFVEAAASAFIRGMDTAGIACAVKHFPGNSGADPHYGRSVLTADKAALDSMAAPFAGIIKNLRPQALMVSHVLVPALDAEHIASLSPRIMTQWLREELEFQGIIIADDFSMAGAAAGNQAAAAVEALAAGADMVMVWPHTIAAVHKEILRALDENRLSRERLREAAERIIAGKLRYGLLRGSHD